MRLKFNDGKEVEVSLVKDGQGNIDIMCDEQGDDYLERWYLLTLNTNGKLERHMLSRSIGFKLNKNEQIKVYK
jgi:hypothetical protein